MRRKRPCCLPGSRARRWRVGRRWRTWRRPQRPLLPFGCAGPPPLGPCRRNRWRRPDSPKGGVVRWVKDRRKRKLYDYRADCLDWFPLPFTPPSPSSPYGPINNNTTTSTTTTNVYRVSDANHGHQFRSKQHLEQPRQDASGGDDGVGSTNLAVAQQRSKPERHRRRRAVGSARGGVNKK